MKKMLLGIALVFAAVSGKAQTYNFTLGTSSPTFCGPYNTASYYCAGTTNNQIAIAISNADGTTLPPDPSGNLAHLFYEPLHNGLDNQLNFFNIDGLGQAPVHSISTVAVPNTSPQSYRQTVGFAGTTTDGKPYSGSSTVVFYTMPKGGRYGGTNWYIVGGTATVTVQSTSALASPIAPTPTSCPGCGKGSATISEAVTPNYGGFILVCGWTGVIPPYWPTGHVGSDGVQVGATCEYYNTLTGTYGTPAWMTWWIPWSTWFFPPAQTPYCESAANYNSSACTQQINVNAVKQSTPQHPAL